MPLKKVHRSLKVEIDPSNRIRGLLYQHSGAHRFAWNWALARRKELFATKEGKEKFSNAQADNKIFVQLKKEDPKFSWCNTISSRVTQEAFRDLDKAFHSLITKKARYPKFKAKHKSQDSFRLYGLLKAFPHSIQLPVLGLVRTKESLTERDKDTHQMISKIKGRILSVTVSRTANRWFASILWEQDVVVSDTQIEFKLPEDRSTVCGIDLGISSFATLQDGEKYFSPKPLKKALKRLKKRQKQASHKTKGSNNRFKANRKVAKIHYQVACKRSDFIHKVTTELAKTKPVIVIEDLSVKGMMSNHCLAQALSDQGFGEFRRQLEYKTERYGSKLIVADRWYPSSKLCSSCGYRMDKLPLNIRSWTCPSCQEEHDRDINAAKNLSKYPYCEGNSWSLKGSSKPVESPPGFEGSLSNIRDSLKQEVGFCKIKPYKTSGVPDLCQVTG